MTTSDVLILSAAGMLVSAYLMVGQKALFTAIRLFGVQSLLLGVVAITIAVAESRRELFVMAAITIDPSRRRSRSRERGWNASTNRVRTAYRPMSLLHLYARKSRINVLSV